MMGWQHGPWDKKPQEMSSWFSKISVLNKHTGMRQRLHADLPIYSIKLDCRLTSTWAGWTMMTNGISLLYRWVDRRVPVISQRRDDPKKMTCHDGSVSFFVWLFLTQDGKQWEALNRYPPTANSIQNKDKKNLPLWRLICLIVNVNTSVHRLLINMWWQLSRHFWIYAPFSSIKKTQHVLSLYILYIKYPHAMWACLA